MERARRRERGQQRRDADGARELEVVVVDGPPGESVESLEALRQRFAEWVAQPRRPAARGEVECAFCGLEPKVVIGRRRRRQP
jgi:hypothetical protein